MSLEALTKEHTYHMAYVDVDPDFILNLLKVKPGGVVVGDKLIECTHDAIPQDARAVRCGITEGGNIRIAMSSPELRPTKHGGLMPVLAPVYSERQLDKESEMN